MLPPIPSSQGCGQESGPLNAAVIRRIQQGGLQAPNPWTLGSALVSGGPFVAAGVPMDVEWCQ